MDNYIYRRATLDDLNEILSIGNLIADFDFNHVSKPFWDYDVLKNCIDNNQSGSIICAFLDDNLVGFAITEYNFVFKKGIIENMFVLPKCRNHGIARKLFSMLLNDAKENDLNSLSINTEFNNISVISFLEKNGFEKSLNNVEMFLNLNN